LVEKQSLVAHFVEAVKNEGVAVTPAVFLVFLEVAILPFCANPVITGFATYKNESHCRPSTSHQSVD